MDVMEPRVGPPRPDAPDPEVVAPATAGSGRVEAWVRRAWARSSPRGVVTFAIVAACTYFVFHELNPGGVVFEDSTPTGGDMGAHVWGPAFLRDELLTDFRVTGWAADWYLGFPAYQFYFVVPALAIVALNVGLPPLAAALLIGCVVLLVWRTYVNPELARLRTVGWVALGVVSVLVIGMPYGIAFKLVAVSGLVAMPVCAWAMGRLAGLPFPGPALLSVATLIFVFDRSFNILGGNGASTMAGEFSFAISLSLALLYLGFLIRGLDTGRGRVTAGVLLALCGLCHLIPVFFALGATAAVLLLRMGRRQVTWLAVTGALAGLLSAFWIVPFVLRQDYLNDMGWEKYERYVNHLFTRDSLNPDFLVDGPPLELMVALAALGFVVSLMLRRRLGILLGVWAIGVAAVFVGMGEGWPLLSGDRLWNARLLPFYYLCVYMLAVLGVGEVLGLVARSLRNLGPIADPDRFRRYASLGAPLLVFVVVFFVVAMPLGAVPGGERGDDGTFRWGPLSTAERNFVPGWAAWNFSGYEAKQANATGGGYDEYYDIVTTMDEVGRTHGCGQSFWEFAPELGRYGTTMAMMLLPHWTDRCVGSMEGLYFEASATVPYHFLLQTELSGPSTTDDDGETVGGPSQPMRGLPYTSFDIETGVDHLQMMGVGYYLAFSETAVDAARGHPDLTEVATSGPWHVYTVSDAPRVEPLENEPVVWADVSDHQDQWLDPAVAWFQDPSRWDVYQASSGPDDWQRVDAETLEGIAAGDPVDYETRPLPEVEVSDVAYGRDTISFEVDTVGVPVLVKASYFPNWQVSGAEGPHRVAPNMMVVIPTGTEVELSYGRTPVDLGAAGLTLVGIALAVVIARRPDPGGRAWFDWVRWLDLEAAHLRERRRRNREARIANERDLLRPDRDPPAPDPPTRDP